MTSALIEAVATALTEAGIAWTGDAARAADPASVAHALCLNPSDGARS